MHYYWGSLFNIDTANENYPELIRLLLSLSDAFQVVLANHRVSAKLPTAPRSRELHFYFCCPMLVFVTCSAAPLRVEY